MLGLKGFCTLDIQLTLHNPCAQEPVQPGLRVRQLHVGAGDAEPVQGVPRAAVGGVQLAESLPGALRATSILLA